MEVEQEQPGTTESPEVEAPAEPPETPPEEPPKEDAPAGEPEGGEPEAPGGEEPAQAKTETSEAERPKRTGGYQRKIERLERQNQILVEQLQRFGGQPPMQPVAPKEKTPSEQAEELLQGMVRKGIAELDAQRQAQAGQQEFQRRVDEARAARADWDDVIDSVSHMPVSQALHEALLTSDKPGEIMYQLARNPAELARVSALPPLIAAREIGKLEARLASGAAPQKPSPANRPPAPPSKVNGAASSTRSLESLPISEFKRRMRSGG